MPRYIIYARKSSESEERQVLSVESQLRELRLLAHSQELNITAVLSESRSAKAPGRAVFGELMGHVAKGNVDGILCWKLDRLARNPVDGGALIWAFDEGRLSQIVTPQRTFTNTGNDKFWMQLEFGMAKKYVDDLSDNVKRGNRMKLEQGWLPGIPPIGYLNDLAKKTIIPDPDRFLLVRKMWDSVLAGTQPAKVLHTANEEWGLRTPRFRRRGGRPLAYSTFYKLLSTPFYYGLIVRNGESYRGAHKAMITKDEYDTVQTLLGRSNRLPQKQHAFAFTGLIRCGECGAAITAENKTNRYGSKYTYYHCTRRRRGYSCTQGVVQVDELESQITDVLQRIHIADDFRGWALQNMRTVHRDETSARQATDQSLALAYNDTKKKLDTLVDLKLGNLVTAEEYSTKRQKLSGELIRLKERLEDTDGRATSWLKLAERAFVFANEARGRFTEGTLDEKREILTALGSNLVLKDKKLQIRLQEPFRLIEEGLRGLVSKADRFEPQVQPRPVNQNRRSTAPMQHWGALIARVRTFFVEHPTLIQWPTFCRTVNSGTSVKSSS
jgi:DNA invertase Pin-like site-specific DNA recombinase